MNNKQDDLKAAYSRLPAYKMGANSAIELMGLDSNPFSRNDESSESFLQYSAWIAGYKFGAILESNLPSQAPEGSLIQLPKKKKNMNNFILLVDQNTGKLLITLPLSADQHTGFQELSKTAFITHFDAPKTEFEFEDFELGCQAKDKWKAFFDKQFNK